MQISGFQLIGSYQFMVILCYVILITCFIVSKMCRILDFNKLIVHTESQIDILINELF